MKQLLMLLTAVVVVSVLPSISQATCVVEGTIPRIFIRPGLPTNIGVRPNGAEPTFFNFTSTNQTVITAALVAEASHITVRIIGDAAQCGEPVNNVSNGGTVVQFLVSP